MKKLLSFCLLSCVTHATLQAQWIQQPFPSTEFLYKVRFADPQTGWILGANNLYKTSDGGLSWVPQKTTTGYGQALHVLTANVVFHGNLNSVLERSTNGGATWKTVDTVAMAYLDFDFISPLVGFAAGGSGSPLQAVIRKTTDGGATWMTLPISFIEGEIGGEIEGISFVGEDRGWAVSYRGLMYNTTNGGQSWSFQDTVGRAKFGFNAPVRDVQFTTVDSGWAVGGLSMNNVIARTIDGGKAWTFLTPWGSSWREIQMLNSHLGWIVGATYAPYIARTTNGGESWEVQSFSRAPNPSRGLESISMIDENLGWAVGAFGDVYKTTNGGVGVVSVDESLTPLKFHLAQNYPNPFNSSTVIPYELSVSSLVTLKVHNVLAQEVATVVNEEIDPGSYKVTFDAGGLSSGVYFYRLRAGSFTETKRFVLLR